MGWPLPFSGIAVVASGDALALRLCCRLLAEAGARVLRLPPAEDRVAATPYGADWAAFADAGTRPLADADAEAALARADLYLTSLPHDDPLGCDAVLARHPKLEVGCITPLGQDGPYAGLAADDVVLCALSGLADATPGLPDHRANADEPPVQSLARLAETSAAITAATAIAATLVGRLRGRPGPRHVECAALEAATAMMVVEWGVALNGGGARGRRPVVLDPSPNTYVPTADGEAVIATSTQAHWRAIVELMGSPDWALDERFADGSARARNWDVLGPPLRAWVASQHGAELLAAAQARGLPIAVSMELAETVACDHMRERASVRTQDGTIWPADPIVFDGSRRDALSRVADDDAPRPALAAPATGGADSAGADADEPDPLAPLRGVRVLDLGQLVAAPYCGQLLAALGADVTVVEPPGMPVSRQFPPFAGEPRHDASAIFNQINRGKRSVQLDLAQPDGAAALRALVRDADVLLENFSPRAIEKLGLTWDALHALNPRLVLGSVSAFGRSGPWGRYVALHSGVLLLSGTASVTRDETGRMRLAGQIYPDLLAGAMLGLAVVEGLAARERSGEGTHVEVAMGDVMLYAMGGLLPAAGRGERFETHPARFLATAEPRGFLAVSGPVEGALAAEVAQLPKADAMARLQARGTYAGAVLDITEVMVDPHLHARGFVTTDEHPITGVRPVQAAPWRFDGRRPRLGPAPLLGEANDELLARAGVTTRETR